MRPQRQVVDYSLRRHALLRDLRVGRVGIHEVCDASPYLLSAARFHGERTDERCPVCRREYLTHVHYIYGDELKQSAGQARSRAELAILARTVQEIQVYVVEVCRGCGWNHLVEQFLLGRASRPAGSDAVELTSDSSIHEDHGAAGTEVDVRTPQGLGSTIVNYLPVDGTLSVQGDSPRSKGVTG
ncbi:MAG: DUF5318 domain-containing protein [Micromonosporaceae bacterium]|nr:DUF5318 domain-containing protein [Micromonosporaceae bacterium]